jgi:hypothetical protein
MLYFHCIEPRELTGSFEEFCGTKVMGATSPPWEFTTSLSSAACWVTMSRLA